jgi:hypothetical protein
LPSESSPTIQKPLFFSASIVCLMFVTFAI